MASEVQNGTGILHGIGDNGSGITMSGYATFILESAKGGHKFKLEPIEDEMGFDAALIATNAHVEMDITWTPSGASRAAAATTAVFLTPLAKVTLANFKVEAFNGDWVYVGDQSIDLSHGNAKMSLKVRKYDDSTQNASLTTTVSG
jgi:hypothetical protein